MGSSFGNLNNLKPSDPSGTLVSLVKQFNFTKFSHCYDSEISSQIWWGTKEQKTMRKDPFCHILKQPQSDSCEKISVNKRCTKGNLVTITRNLVLG